MSGLVGVVIEAWDELRIHKLRVLLSLIGVAVAVAAIALVTAAVQILQQGYTELQDRQNGRSVTVMVNAYQNSGQPSSEQTAALTAAMSLAAQRYSISWSSVDVWVQTRVRFPSGSQDVQLRAVDPQFGVMYRVPVTQGSWFSDGNAGYGPQLVVNKAFLKAYGLTSLTGHPTVQLGTTNPVTATVIGVYSESWQNDSPAAYARYDQLSTWQLLDSQQQNWPTVELWVPAGIVTDLEARLPAELTQAAPGWQISTSDNRSWGSNFLEGATRWVILGVSGLALLLGGLGLVNIALTTVRYRIREIGVRRSFGATSARVFFAVMMESVVATAVAGAVGVGIAVVALRYLPLGSMFGLIQDSPPFPLAAAGIGMAAATGVGALAGLLPALYAVRVPVIDAIRY